MCMLRFCAVRCSLGRKYTLYQCITITEDKATAGCSQVTDDWIGKYRPSNYMYLKYAVLFQFFFQFQFSLLCFSVSVN